MPSIRLVPQRVNLDLHESLVQPDMARFLKNVVYDLQDTSIAGDDKGGQTGVLKFPESNDIYISQLRLPEGYNHCIGVFPFKETKEAFVFVYNDKGNHTLYRINGETVTYNTVYQGSLLNFQLDPENFIHFGAATLEILYLTDPDTGKKVRRSFLNFTDNFNPMRFICVEDSIETFGFNDNISPYFRGTYERDLLINVGVPTPKDCIEITEVEPDITATQNNRLLFNTWQFRLLYTDVWGRPSEHGIISAQYIPGAGNCNPSSANLPRCLKLSFDAPPPYINTVSVEYRNCNNEVWKKAETLNLYAGSPIGIWWQRERNSDVNYDSNTGKITYEFCADKECEIIPTNETSRLDNPAPRTSGGVVRVGDALGWFNNKDHFLPFSQELNRNFQIIVDSPVDADPANSDVRNIDILVEIWNTRHGSQPIYQGVSEIAGTNKVYGFGAYKNASYEKMFAIYKQFFINKDQQGLIGYLAGTNAYTVSRQWLLNESTGTFSEITNFTDLTLAPAGSGFRYFQRFTFTNIPKGKYIFRISDPQTNPSINPNYQKTSTTVWGQFPSRWLAGMNPENTPRFYSDEKELVIDVCDKNYDSQKDEKILTIYDAADYYLSQNLNQTLRKGYIRNTDELDELKVGIELMRVEPYGSYTGLPPFSNYTDHNGFYWAAKVSSRNAQGGANVPVGIRFFGKCGCVTGEQFNYDTPFFAEFIEKDFSMNKSNCPDYSNKLCSYIKIVGQVRGCGTNAGIPNVGVVLARGGTAITDENGFYTIIAHDDIRNGDRHDKLYYITNSCGFTDCNSDCIEPYDVTIEQCVVCLDRTINVPNKFILFFDVVRGLLSGGSYPIGVTGFDWLGRATFVQPLKNITIPGFQETKAFAPSKLRALVNSQSLFPPETQYITFWIGAETSISDYITWIVDDFQFIDNTGLVNDVAPTQIKIYYKSLIEFNKQNNFATTTNWGFLDASNNAALTDKIEFLFNGNGEFFDKHITALVKYDKDGQYVLINYTNDLKNLKPNALIRLVRPKECTNTEPYFEIPCSKIEIKDRRPVTTEIVLDAYDTFYQKREIPVPVLQTAADPNADPPTVDVFANELRIFGTPFESKSVSDFWGEGCWNVGRVNSKNPYETELYHLNQIALTGAMSDTGFLNYQNYFDTSKKISFDDVNLNTIVSAIAKQGLLLIIGQNNTVRVGYNDNVLRANAQGQILVSSLANSFGKPELMSPSNYGCKLFDKNTVYEKDGFVQFLDATKSCVVQSNFQSCYSISVNGADGYIRSKIKAVGQYNNTHNGVLRYFHGCVNPESRDYYLTDFVIKSGNYLNLLREHDVDVQETLLFNVLSKAFKGTTSFTPEYFFELEGENMAQQFGTFKNGIPYRHYTTANPNKTYNIFYGVQCETVIEMVVVIDPFIKKRPLAIGQYCKQGLYFADRVITETGQQSRILLTHWLQANYGHYAPFLCDINTPQEVDYRSDPKPNAILDGNQLGGTWVKVRFVSDPKTSQKYSELQGFTIKVFGIENVEI